MPGKVVKCQVRHHHVENLLSDTEIFSKAFESFCKRINFQGVPSPLSSMDDNGVHECDKCMFARGLTGINISIRYGAAAHDEQAEMSVEGWPMVPIPANARATSASSRPCASPPPLPTENASSTVGLERRDPLRDPGRDPGRDAGCDRDMENTLVSSVLCHVKVRDGE